MAELLSCYFPADIQLHSYSNVHSLERKKNNWYLLDKFFKARGTVASIITHGALHLSASLPCHVGQGSIQPQFNTAAICIAKQRQ